MTSGTSSDSGVNVELLEKRLDSLRDTQESVQGLSIWCQANKKYATSIIESWLKCLKRSPVEKRLTLFYLANDVVQHAKRKGDTTLINQWAVAVQKATPHVRSPSSISSAIARIFKIWEERNIYSRDAVVDLLALLNTASAKEKTEKRSSTKKPETYTATAEKVQKFDPNVLISKVKVAYKLKSHLGNTFRTKQYFNMKMEQLIGSIKDRQHGMEVIHELSQLLEECKSSEHKLLTEVEERRKLVEIAEIGIVSYENVRGEAVIVNTAYKNFTGRVESTKEKVDEKLKMFQAMESPETSFSAPDFGLGNSNSTGKGNNNYDLATMFHNSNQDALTSISLPPGKPQSNSAEKVTPSQYSSFASADHSRGDSTSGYNPQQSLYNPAMPTTGYDISSTASWTTDSYSSMMSNMMQMQYPPPPQPQPPQAPEPVTNTATSPPVFTLTPSMQLQMQMQQQHVAALQQFQGPSQSQGYSSVNNNYHSPQKSANYAAPPDLGLIPLPPSDNPPLPPEPNHNISNTSNISLPDTGYPPPLPDYSIPPPDQQSQHDSSFDSNEMDSSAYGTQYHQYNNSQSQESSLSYGNAHGGGGGDKFPHQGPGPGATSTPSRPQFGNAGARFPPHQRNNLNSSYNGYTSTGGFEGSPPSNLAPGPAQNYRDNEFGNVKAPMDLNGDEPRLGGAGAGGSIYDNSPPDFYDPGPGPGPPGPGYNSMGMRPPGLSPQKPRMFQPSWRGGGRGRPPYPYDGGGGGFRGRGMRGVFRSPRRGFR